MMRINGTDRVLTGWGRTAPSRAYVAGPMETTQLQEIIAAQPARGVLARGAGRSYGDAAQNAGGYVLAPVTRPCVEVDAGADRRLRTVLNHLDRRVADAGDRVYLAKDVRMRADAFAAMYSSLAEWREVRELLDPRKVFSSDLGRRLSLC